MDPDSAFEEISNLINNHNDGLEIDAERLEDLCYTLNCWLCRDGFAPKVGRPMSDKIVDAGLHIVSLLSNDSND